MLPRQLKRIVTGGLATGFVLAGLAFMLGTGAAAADGDALGAFIPGAVVSDAELGSIHGKGVTVVSFGGGRVAATSIKPPNLRDSVMGAMRSAGVRPSLNPSGPNGTSGSALPSATIPAGSVKIPDIGNSSMSVSRSF
jgi:hypothetical protein